MGELIAFPAQAQEQAPAQAPARAAVPTPARSPEPAPGHREPEPLWRDLVGHELREERHRQGRTLADVAEQAGVSTPYLSEVERGRKEPSSEVLGAVTGALGIGLVDLTSRVTRSLQARPSGPLALAA